MSKNTSYLDDMKLDFLKPLNGIVSIESATLGHVDNQYSDNADKPKFVATLKIEQTDQVSQPVGTSVDLMMIKRGDKSDYYFKTGLVKFFECATGVEGITGSQIEQVIVDENFAGRKVGCKLYVNIGGYDSIEFYALENQEPMTLADSQDECSLGYMDDLEVVPASKAFLCDYVEMKPSHIEWSEYDYDGKTRKQLKIFGQCLVGEYTDEEEGSQESIVGQDIHLSWNDMVDFKTKKITDTRLNQLCANMIMKSQTISPENFKHEMIQMLTDGAFKLDNIKIMRVLKEQKRQSDGGAYKSKSFYVEITA